MPQKLARTFIG